jgi:hypothetical protein
MDFEGPMLSRLLSNIDGVEASLLTDEDELAVVHEAARLGIGAIQEIWIEAEFTTVTATLRGGRALQLTSEVLPVGRMSHEARTLRPVIEDLIEV